MRERISLPNANTAGLTMEELLMNLSLETSYADSSTFISAHNLQDASVELRTSSERKENHDYTKIGPLKKLELK